jgi:uncharacterized membrane protein
LPKKKEWHTAGLLCLVVGTLGTIAAVLTGPEEGRNPLYPTHELYGKLTMTFFIALSLVRLWFYIRKKRDLGGNAVYLTAALIGVLLVSYTGHLGGKMVHPDRQGPGGQFQFRQGNRPTQGDRPSVNGQNQPE